MTEWLRRAGRGRLPDGSAVTWTVAEGNRGRRWRWTLCQGDRIAVVGLIELAPDGLFGRLELALPNALVTLHPDDDRRAAHGNVVTAGGVRPVAVPWDPGWGIGIEGDAFGSAVGGSGSVGLWFGRDLSWTANVQLGASLALDERGVPRLDDAAEWPVEE
jgi:hypothetical protein